jgi:prepilin-type N-terminal cleavage/methylation domain-containing protein
MRRSKGFSLVEIAVALAIVALLLAGMLMPLSAQIDVRNGADTQRTMESIRDAIIGFAQANGRLPCPADGSVPAGTAGAGTELLIVNSCAAANSASCTAINGAVPCWVVPWATLGTPETDAWGRRFSYRVSPAFADLNAANTWATTTPAAQNPGCAPTPLPTAPTSFALCSLGSIAVFTRGGANTTAVLLGATLPAVIISLGKNGFGAWQPNGTRLGPLPVGNDEAANANGNMTATPTGGYSSWTFYSRTPTPAAAGCVDPAPGFANAAPACEFDDIVLMISSSTLVTRMVAAGKLP